MFKINVLINFANFTGKLLCLSLLLIKLQFFLACNFIKKRLQHRLFPAKFLKIPFFTEHLRWLFFEVKKGAHVVLKVIDVGGKVKQYYV